jgi:hypothetical protein
MPFDGVGFALEDRVGKIDKVIDLLATPDKWCKGVLRTPDGRRCIRGAMMAVEGAHCLQPAMLQAIREVTGKHYLRIESFNDHVDTDHTQVLAVLGRARDHLISAQLDADHCTTSVPAGWRARLRALFNDFRATEAAA